MNALLTAGLKQLVDELLADTDVEVDVSVNLKLRRGKGEKKMQGAGSLDALKFLLDAIERANSEGFTDLRRIVAVETGMKYPPFKVLAYLSNESADDHTCERAYVDDVKEANEVACRAASRFAMTPELLPED